MQSMQFGRALDRILQRILLADPCHGPVHLLKVDIADGFYRMHVAPCNVPKLRVLIPPGPNGIPLVAFPAVLPMGWVKSLLWFWAVMETMADLANIAFQAGHAPLPLHRLEASDSCLDAFLLRSTAAAAPSLFPTLRKKPLQHANVYMDNFLLAA